MLNQQTLNDELRFLDAETFEIEDISDLGMDAANVEGDVMIMDDGSGEMLAASTSCSSCCSCSCSSCCSCSCSSCCSCSCSSCCA